MNIFNSMILVGNMSNNQIWLPIAMVGAFIVFYYFLFIRPQSRKRKETQNMLNSLKKGDRIVTIGGIHGKVVSSKANEITIRVDSNAEITFEKSAISKVLTGNNQPQTQPKNKEKGSNK